MEALTVLVPGVAAGVWWALAAVLALVGIAGVVLPVLPGTVLVLAGLGLGAWIDGFERVGPWAIAGLVVLAVLGWATDFVAALLGARKVGASRWALIGAALGTVVGLLAGLVGVLVFPFIGAVLGEWLALRRQGVRPGAADASPVAPGADPDAAAATASGLAHAADAGHARQATPTVPSAIRPAEPAGAEQRALRVGLATWIGLLIGTAVKLALSFAMVGVFAMAYWI